MFIDKDEDSDNNTYQKDESDKDDGSDYDDFWFKNHLEDLSYNVTYIFCCCLSDFLLWLSDSLRTYKLEKLKDCNQRRGTIWDPCNI